MQFSWQRKVEQHAVELEKQKQEDKLVTYRDDIMQGVRKFLSNGAAFSGVYFSHWFGCGCYRHADPNLPFQIIITGDPVIENFNYSDSGDEFGERYNYCIMDPLDRVFGIPAHLKWLGETESFSPWTFDSVKEYDGILIVAIKIQNRDSANPLWRVTMKYCVRDKKIPDTWVSLDNGSVWNGAQFVGLKKSALALIAVQRKEAPIVASPNVVVPRTVSQNRFLESTAPIVEPQQNQVFSMPLPKMSFTRK